MTSRVSVDDEHSGQTSTSTTENAERIREFIHEDRHQKLHELADIVGISYRVCHILTENFNMHHIAIKFVPRLKSSGL
jgi:hypothetical protein